MAEQNFEGVRKMSPLPADISDMAGGFPRVEGIVSKVIGGSERKRDNNGGTLADSLIIGAKRSPSAVGNDGNAGQESDGLNPGYWVIDDDGFPPVFFPSADGRYPAGLVDYVFETYPHGGNFRVAYGSEEILRENLRPHDIGFH
ncbi:hypothetical protein HYU14_04295 [Candidatus Woesearchaeota archaeon]|nr:hypothetical protein [Candidatus Woesearchaeota archaeon]